MKKLLLLLLCVPVFGVGQGWHKQFTDNIFGYYVQQTSDGGYIATGGSVPPNVSLLKTNNLGDSLWLKFPYQGIGRYVEQTTDGGFIIIGTFGGNAQPVNQEVLLVKTNDQGDLLWSQTFGVAGTASGYDGQQTTDGGYIITGGTNSGNNQDAYLIKTDSNGNEEWNQTFGGPLHDWGWSVEQTTDGGYIIVGLTDVNLSPTGTDDNIFLIKTDNQGNLLWENNFDIFGSEWGASIQQTTDGGYIITGTSNSIDSTYLFLMKTDINGNQLWNKIFPGGSGTSVQQTTDGGYIIAGVYWIPDPPPTWNPEYGTWDILVIKTDNQGDSLWSKTIGDTLHDYGSSIQQTTDGGYILVGYSSNMTLGLILDLIKIDSSGNVTSISNPSILYNTHKDLLRVIDILGREVNEQRNTPLFYIYDDGTVEKKIIIE